MKTIIAGSRGIEDTACVPAPIRTSELPLQ